MANLQNADMLKGSQMMIFKKVGTGSANTTWRSIGFATNHQVSIQWNSNQINTKDHGDYPATDLQTMTWSVTAENVYSDAGELTYMQAMTSMEPVEIFFSKVDTSREPAGVQGGAGIIGVQANGSWTKGATIVHGKALVTDFQINAPAGDYATLSVTFTGVGELTTT